MTPETFTMLIIGIVFYLFIVGLTYTVMSDAPGFYTGAKQLKPPNSFSYKLAILILSLSWFVLPLLGYTVWYFFSKES